MENIFDTLIEEEMKTSYIDYAMSVIVGRALPDVRDGLKPVQRRILFAMRQLGLLPTRPFRKSATVVGEVIGKFHPHGDMAVYDALVRMAQDFSLRYLLIQGQGNFGSIDGDPPAAYRYTEVRLSNLAMEMLADLDEDTVDHVPNFDGRLQEPSVLPSKVPNLLVNGSSGIAVGMATNIPPHNIREIIDALLAIVDDPEITDEALLGIVRGPDFPTGGIIVGNKGIRDVYLNGHGRLVVRSRADFKEEGKQSKIIVSEIPYQVPKSQIIEKIAHTVREKKIDGISDLRDESDREGLRIVIEVKKGYDIESIYRQLLKHTPLQSTFSVTLLALVNGEPKILTLRQMLHHYLNHRQEIVERRTRFRLKKAENRAHIVEGFIKALGMIDRVIELIKKAQDSEGAKKALIKEMKFTEAQAKAILEMRLASLTRLEQDKLQGELKELKDAIKEFKAILRDRERLFKVIKEELIEIKKKYGDERRTEISEDEQEVFELADLIPEEDVAVTLTHLGYIKRTPLRYYRQQARGGTGRSGIKVYEEDFPTSVVIANNHDNLLFFTNLGRVFSIKVYHVPEGSLQSKGRPVKNFLRLKKEERVTTVIPYRRDSKGEYVFLVTEKGTVKKTSIDRFRSASRRGIIAIGLREGDNLVGGLLTNGNNEIIIAKSDGRAMRFHEKDVRAMSRTAMGVKGSRIRGKEKVVSVVRYDETRRLLTITERGFGKCVDIRRIQRQKRGGVGIKIQKISTKTGRLVNVALVNTHDQIIIITLSGSVIRLRAKEVKRFGRYASGVRLMKVKPDDKVVDLAIIRTEIPEGQNR